MIAESAQSNILGQLFTQILPVFTAVAEACVLSQRRQNSLNKQDSHVGDYQGKTLAQIAEKIFTQVLIKCWKAELKTAFTKAKELDDAAKAKGAGKGDTKKKPKKGAEEKPAGIQLGRGCR